MNGPAFFGHVADYSSTTSIIAFVLIAVAILFIYLYNSLSMRRSQLDRQLAHIRIILKRRTCRSSRSPRRSPNSSAWTPKPPPS